MKTGMLFSKTSFVKNGWNCYIVTKRTENITCTVPTMTAQYLILP